jgi:hypothetical protein
VLRELTLRIDSHTHELHPLTQEFRLELPHLNRFCLVTSFFHHSLEWLNAIHTSKLKELLVASFEVDIDQTPPVPQNRTLTHNLDKLGLSIPIDCFPQFLQHHSIDTASELAFRFGTAHSKSVNLEFGPLRFKNLRNFFFESATEPFGGESYPDDFLDQFDFSSATNHATISCHFPKLEIPKVKSIFISPFSTTGALPRLSRT